MAANSSSCAVWVRLPAERDAAQFRIHQHGAVAVVPGEAQQAGLSGAIVLQAARKLGHRGAGAARDGFEDVAGGRKARFDAGVARDGPSPAPRRRRRESDPACSPIAMMQVEVPTTFTTSPSAHARADGVPVRIERADRNRNARRAVPASPPTPATGVRRSGRRSRSGRPACRERRPAAGRRWPGTPPAGSPPNAGVPHPFVAHGADAARHLRGIGDAAQHRRHHVAMFQRGGHARALVRDCGAASAAAWRSPTRRNRCRRTSRCASSVSRVRRRGDLGGFLQARWSHQR